MSTLRTKVATLIRNRAIPKTKELLLELAGVVEDVVILATVMPHEYSALRYGGVNYVKILRWERADRALRQRIVALRRSKYIATRMIGNKLHCTLTDRGVAEILRFRCRAALQCPKGKRILVTFDIPESERRVRLNFRRFLGECGFRLHQRSVWTCDRDVLIPLQEFIKKAGIAKWISVFAATEEST